MQVVEENIPEEIIATKVGVDLAREHQSKIRGRSAPIRQSRNGAQVGNGVETPQL